MNFLKNLFSDESTIIGLSGFSFARINQKKIKLETNFYFNPFEREKVFETNYIKNNLLL